MAAILTSIGRVYSIDSSGAASESQSEAEARLGQSFPAVKSVGQELTATMEQWFRAGRDRRLDNLSTHVERAIAISGRDAVEAVSETPSFAEWAEGASKVDLKDQALADIWQAALLALEKGGAGRLRPLCLAERMQPDEAAAFATLARRKPIKTAAIERLKGLGLIKTARNRIFNRVSIFTYLLTFSLACLATTLALVSSDLFPQLATLWNEARQGLQGQIGLSLPPAVLVLCVGSLCAAVPMLLHLFLDASPLTEDGKALAGFLKKVTGAPKAEAAERPATAPKLALAV